MFISFIVFWCFPWAFSSFEVYPCYFVTPLKGPVPELDGILRLICFWLTAGITSVATPGKAQPPPTLPTEFLRRKIQKISERIWQKKLNAYVQKMSKRVPTMAQVPPTLQTELVPRKGLLNQKYLTCCSDCQINQWQILGLANYKIFYSQFYYD